MTEQTNTNPEPRVEKKPKKKGPIRLEAIIPFVIFVALTWLYFALFFDGHVRRAIEFGGTYANGAEVNIGNVRTSFLGASLEISDIQVTNANEPTKNTVQIGKIRWKMLWDALLRGKVAINEASILEIGIGTQRQRPGRVLPKDPPGTKSASEKLREAALEEAKKQFDGNVLSDVAAILGGVDPKEQLKSIGDQLSSVVRTKELQNELKKKEREWKDRIASLPQSKDLKDIESRIKAVKVDRFNGPLEVQQSIRELDAIRKDVDARVKAVDEASKTLGSDVNTYSKALAELEAQVRKDIDDIEKRLKIPELDVKSIAGDLFGNLFLAKVEQAQGYMEKARRYMPPKKTAAEKAEFQPPTPRERAAGRNYKFGRPNSYPLFWLQKAEISSKSAGSEFSGDVTGTLTNLTDDPPIIGKPTVLTFKGDFPKQDMSGVLGEVIIDHTTDQPMEQLTAKVANFRVKGQSLVSSTDVQLGFKQARAGSELKVKLERENVTITSESAFSNIDYLIDAKKPIVKDILTNVIKSVPLVTLNAGLSGTWSSLDFNLNTNLGPELQKGFEKELQTRITEARTKIKSFVDGKIGAEKENLMAEYKKIESQMKGQIDAKKAEIDKFKAQIDEAKAKTLKDSGKKLEQEAKKGLDSLLKSKKLGF